MDIENRRMTAGFYIKVIANRLHYKTEQLLAGYGITEQQGKVLGVVLEAVRSRREISRKYLQEMMQLSGPSVTSLLDALEQKGLIVRGVCTEDRRLLTVTVTQQGKRLIEGVKEVFRQQESQLLSGMSEEDAERFYSLLEAAYQRVR